MAFTAQTELGPELPDVFTDDVGFKGVSGDSNVQLLPTPWPADALPAPTCSLLAIASSKGMVVGAGPDALTVSSTEAVRKAISAPTGEEKVTTKAFQPQNTIALPARPTHVTFASGDSALVLATENGFQLSVFDTASLSQANVQPALGVPANGATFRSVVPNPSPAGDAHSTLVALVTINGELLMADLKGGNLAPGPSGPVLKTGVSSVCWSNKGKQLVAGLGDGTGYQMTPDGAQKDLIPRPPDLEGECHVSSIAWLENDIFLMVYTPNVPEDDMGMNPPSSYYIITRRKQGPFLIQKMPELCGPFGFKRTPAYQFIARMRDYKPNLKDVLILSSTASTDLGLITRADKPLSNEDSAQGTVNLFTTTELSDDTKRASLPLKDSVDETSVVGLGLDLSSRDIVVSPIQGEDITESPTPLPNILLLNNDGILCSWWFIYSEAIRQNIPYQGLTPVGQQPQPPQAARTPPRRQPQAQPAFGQPSFANQSALGANSASPFGNPPATSPFGKLPAASGFGSPSPLGGDQAPAFGKPSFGQPSFGQPSFGRPSFGQPSFGQPSTPQFGKSGFGQPSASAFGQSSTPTSTPGKSLGSIWFNPGSGGGFGSFAGGGGFAGLAGAYPPEGSPFGRTTGESPFTKLSSGLSSFGQTDTGTAFPISGTDTSKGLTGLRAGGFQLGSTFKPDGTAATDAPKPEKPSGGLFGASLDEMVSTPGKVSPPAESMDDREDITSTEAKPATPQPAPPIFGGLANKTPQAPSAPSSSFNLQKPAEQSQPFSLFGNPPPQKQVASPLSPSEKTAAPPSETPKMEPSRDRENAPMSETPLPPDSTSRAVYNPEDTSGSSSVSKTSVEEAPLPPDFTSKSKPAVKEAPLPPDFTKPSKKAEEEKAEAQEAPLPPEPSTPASVAAPPKESSPVSGVPDEDEREPEPEDEDEDEDEEEEQEESEKEEEDDEEEAESYFADSGEDVANDFSRTESFQSPKVTSVDSSFAGESPDKSPAGGLFNRISKPGERAKQSPRGLFGEVPGKPAFPPKPYESPRSPSPRRQPLKKGHSKENRVSQGPGDTLASRKTSLKLREKELRPQSPDIATQEEQARLHAEAQREKEEALSLSDDDEDERLRADLSRPLEPVPTLDPFLPHQDYSGETTKPGIPGQIERLYRDINSMVDTLGINARSLASFLMYQEAPQDDSNWIDTITSDNPAGVMDEKLLLSQIEKLDDAVILLTDSLSNQRVQGVEAKLGSCRELLGKDIIALRGQCAGIRKTLDAHVDTAAILSAPLSTEQATLQQDLRTVSTDLRAKLADVEQAVSLLRAKIADSPRPDGATNVKRPTVEAVTSTINTMMSMAENKSSDVDMLEVQLKKLGIETSSVGTSTVPSASRSREGSPFTTPRKGTGLRSSIPATPGSRGSLDGSLSAYHTPDSATRFRSSINGSTTRPSRLRGVEAAGDLASKQESERWKAKAQRRQQLVGGLKKAIEEKKEKVRGIDD